MLVAQQTAYYLLEIGAVKLSPLQPFTWASGWKSPIYCDNRLTLSYPLIRTYIKERLASLIKARFPEVEAIAGVATAGIPQASLIADYLQLPMLYVRSKPKNHGLENLVEGKITPRQKVVVVEDLISTGGSSLNAVLALRSEGFDVLGLTAIFTYGFSKAREAFDKERLTVSTLTDYNVLLEVAQKQGIINEIQLAMLEEWRKNPEIWGKES
ncbi:MAG: orotate phosphoribosyltransferase [Cytophagales bacterium]|nr:orotate phosphoribosyltransferase [Cytophagales bacterium]MDW8385161.1 orotate phosphoribosyltransferase [Flammeovirgaceae bacterium]